MLQVEKVANVHFERDVLQAASNPYFPDFHFTFQVSIFKDCARMFLELEGTI